jgi:hypothetical protein
MGRKFPELRLCEGNWKADLIATLHKLPLLVQQQHREVRSERVSAELLPTAKRSKSMQTSQVSGPAHVLHKKRHFKQLHRELPTAFKESVVVS